MAKIREIIKKIESKNTKKITEVALEIAKSDDNQYLILSTFGSDYRKEPGKASQILHIDRDTAKELINIFEAWVK